VWVDAAQRLAAIDYLTLGWFVQPGDDAQQRALAAARRPQQRHELAFVNGQIDIFYGGEAALTAAVFLADVFEFDQVIVCAHGLTPSGTGSRRCGTAAARAGG
jgi:hypothetical protein